MDEQPPDKGDCQVLNGVVDDNWCDPHGPDFVAEILEGPE